MTTLLEMNGVPVGTLTEEGNSCAFEYSDEWLSRGFEMGPYVPLSRGRQYTRPSFGFLEDASPDRWGRTIILRETRARMKKEKRAPRALTTMDHFLRVSDESRMGAIQARRGDASLASGGGVPPMIELARLLRASARYQTGDYDDATLALLLAPGSSLGGARPKASVRDVRGDLYIAKFPKPDDSYSVERWEYVALKIAERAGCRVADASLETVDGNVVLLSKRFDRKADHRVHFSSAMNLLGLTDGDRSSYADIADTMQRTGGDPQELFRRMIVIMINNVDDHLRNHGFLWNGKQWDLSPAYDVNPISRFEKSPMLCTAILPGQFEASTELAIEGAEYFNLTKSAARSICEEVSMAVGTWRQVAQSAGAPRHEIDEVESAFEP